MLRDVVEELEGVARVGGEQPQRERQQQLHQQRVTVDDVQRHREGDAVAAVAVRRAGRLCAAEVAARLPPEA